MRECVRVFACIFEFRSAISLLFPRVSSREYRTPCRDRLSRTRATRAAATSGLWTGCHQSARSVLYLRISHPGETSERAHGTSILHAASSPRGTHNHGREDRSFFLFLPGRVYVYVHVCVYVYIYTRLQCVCTQRDTRARGGDGGSRRKDEAGNKGRDPVRILLAEPYPGSSLCSAGCLLSFLGIKARRTIDRRLSRSFFPSFLGFARTRVKRPGSNSRSLCFITFGLFHEPLFTRTTFREGDL